MPQDPGPSPDEIVRAVEAVLSGPEFQARAVGVRALLSEWIEEHLWGPVRAILETLFDGMPAGVPVAAAGVVLAAAVWAAWRAGAAWAAARKRGRTGDPLDDGGRASVRSPDDWTRVAAARAGAGRLRSAATALYMAMLGRLDQGGALVFHASKTPAEYAREVARGPGHAGAHRFFGAFQALAFGRGEPTPSAYRELESLACASGRGAGEAGEPRAGCGRRRELAGLDAADAAGRRLDVAGPGGPA